MFLDVNIVPIVLYETFRHGTAFRNVLRLLDDLLDARFILIEVYIL